MKKLLYAIITTFIAVVVVVIQPHIVLSQNIAEIAKLITVIVDSTARGSGVLVSKNGNTYYVLTAKHVVENDITDEFDIITPDQSRHVAQNIRVVPEVDLAIVEFTSNQTYTIANVGDSDIVTETTEVTVSGFPKPGQEVTESHTFFSIPGKIVVRPRIPLRDGYAMGYSNPTKEGMSGGPLLDVNGRLVGIHGRAESEAPGVQAKGWINLGIPINTFSQIAPQMGINLKNNSSLARGAYPDWFMSNWMNECTQRFSEEACSCTAKKVTANFTYKEVLEINQVAREGYSVPQKILDLYNSCGVSPF